MTEAPDEKELGQRVDAVAKGGAGVDPEEIMDVVQSVMATIDGELSAVSYKFYSEMEALSRYIAGLKAELAALRPEDITKEHLPAAADELDAIVGATEQATNSIFEAVEAIEDLAGKMKSKGAKEIGQQVTKVYEACSFQDITGQRISKVVKALKHIEEKVQSLLDAFGNEITGLSDDERSRPASAKAPARPDEHLLNGPQSADDAISQDDIDALLSSPD